MQDALALGFQLPPEPIQLEDFMRSLSAPDKERFLSDYIRQTSLSNVRQLNKLLVDRAAASDSPSRLLVDALDVNYRLSGLAAKNLAKEVLATAVSITINIPGRDEMKVIGETIEQEKEIETEAETK